MIDQRVFSILIPAEEQKWDSKNFYFSDIEWWGTNPFQLTLASKEGSFPQVYKDNSERLWVAIHNEPITGSKEPNFLAKVSGIVAMYEEAFVQGNMEAVNSVGGGDTDNLLLATKNKLIRAHGSDLLEDLEYIFEIIRRNE